MNRKYKLWVKIAASLVAFVILVPLSSQAEVEKQIDYTVIFVDESNFANKIFNTQWGAAPEGEIISISFPEQIVGNDGYIWRSVETSPHAVELYGAGTQKYYIEYRQGEQIQKPEDPDAEGEKRLKRWLFEAEEADSMITGNPPWEQGDASLILHNTAQNNDRIYNLVSAVNDVKWHYFYLIGKNYRPETLSIGTAFEAEYSVVNADSFSIGADHYTVLKVGVMRRWLAESCGHSWERGQTITAACLTNGQETYLCKKCSKEETVILPATGHMDTDRDALCDHCKKRAFPQGEGGQIQTVLMTGSEAVLLTFTCIDENYRDTEKMLYLADSVLDESVTGRCFGEGNSYEESGIRRYFRYGFANELSVASALQPIMWEEEIGTADYGALLSKEEYELYAAQNVVKAAEDGYFLRTSDGKDHIYAVDPDGTVSSVAAADNQEFGARPFILLDKPDTEDMAEVYRWKEGDAQARQIGGKTYLFRCVDEDYSDNQSTHRKAALFLCDTVIRGDTDSSSQELKKISFGVDNNYKNSIVRQWLNVNAEDSQFNLEPIYIGVNRAYMGSTKAQSFDQMDKERLIGKDIGFQFMHDRLFCLSLEEAVKYRDVLWRFNGSEVNNPDTQISPYSVGYYLRTPFYEEDETGNFRYSDDVYVVDLVQGNIHSAKTDGTDIGIRPAFAVPMD